MAQKLAPALLAGAGLFGTGAQAATYDWTFTATGGSPAGSGQYTETGGVMTSITGIFDGIAITGLLAPGYEGTWQDNTFPGGGFAFSLASTSTGGWNNVGILDCGAGSADWAGYNGTAQLAGSAGTYSVTLVPEPATLGLFGVAVTGLLAGTRRRARRLPAAA